MRRLILSLGIIVAGLQAQAQDWSGAAVALQRDLVGTGTALGIHFFPNSPDPDAADRGLGVAYVYIEGSAGNSSISVGLFQRAGSAWQLHRPVTGLFGHEPRDPQVGTAGFYLTTSTLGPNDARCCPTEATVWFVDWATGAVVKQ